MASTYRVIGVMPDPNTSETAYRGLLVSDNQNNCFFVDAMVHRFYMGRTSFYIDPNGYKKLSAAPAPSNGNRNRTVESLWDEVTSLFESDVSDCIKKEISHFLGKTMLPLSTFDRLGAR